MVRLLLAVCAALLCLPATAGAAKLSNRDGILAYTGTAATDRVVVWSDGGTVRLQTPRPLHGRGCTTIRTGTAVCRRVERVRISVRGGADNVEARRLRVPAVISGGPGHDTLQAYRGATELRGGPGDDSLDGGPRTVFSGGSGIDSADVSDDARTALAVKVGSRRIARDVEDVRVEAWLPSGAGGGRVTLTGSDGPNHLATGNDDDRLTGGPGTDVLHSGAGNDTIDARDGAPDRIDCGAGADTVLADAIDQLADSCERGAVAPIAPTPGSLINRDGTLTYTVGTAGPDDLVSTTVGPARTPGYDVWVALGRGPIAVDGCVTTPSGYECAGVQAVVVIGGPGRDLIQSSVPATLLGGAGDDGLTSFVGGVVDGGPGEDVLRAAKHTAVRGGTGIDVAALERVRVTPLSLTFDGVADDGLAGEAIDVLPDVEDVETGPPYDPDFPNEPAGPVTLIGSDAPNHLRGASADDVIVGGRGRDELDGAGGDDRLDARDGEADRVLCGNGDDVALVDPVDLVSAGCERVSRARAG